MTQRVGYVHSWYQKASAPDIKRIQEQMNTRDMILRLLNYIFCILNLLNLGAHSFQTHFYSINNSQISS
jgi:hypothetical protein